MKCSLDINKTVEGGKSMHDSYDTKKRGKKKIIVTRNGKKL